MTSILVINSPTARLPTALLLSPNILFCVSIARFAQEDVFHQTGRLFIYQGWTDAHGKEKTLLGEYVYDHKGYALQSFPVQVRTKENGIFDCLVKTMHNSYMFFALSSTGVDCD